MREKNNIKNWELVNFCEFDKYAIKSYCAIHNVDENLNLGDITKVDETKLKDFNLMTWGFPCTDISCAGKQKGFLDEDGNKTRSGMYYEGIRILRYKKPALSIIENVKNLTSKKFQKEFDMVLYDLDEAGYNSYYKVLNAKDFGVPQNRERVFIISIRKDLDNGKFVFPEGFDNGIRLRDVLEDEVDEKYYISDDKVQKFLANLNLDAYEEDINSSRFIGNINRHDFGTGYAGGVWDSNNISPTLTTMQGGGRQPHIMCDANCSKNEIKKVGKINSSQDGIVVSDEGIAPTHTAGNGNTPKVLEMPDTSYCLDANYYKGTTIEQYLDKYRRQLVSDNEENLHNIRIRKLTPKECFRLMGFDDLAYEAASKVVSNSQLYKQCGNSIVVDVLYYILVELYKAMPYLFDDLKLSSFFSGIGAFECALDRLYESINTGNFIEKRDASLDQSTNKFLVVGNTVPSGHTAGRIFDTNGISPTVMERHSKVVQIAENFHKLNKM